MQRGKWSFKPTGEVRTGEEEEAKLPKKEPKEYSYQPIQKGKWTMGEDGKLIPYVEKPKPIVPQVIFDYCDPFVSHHNGQVYTSKKKYRADIKREGFTEVGGDWNAVNKLAEKPDPTKDKDYQRKLQDDIDKAINDVKYGEAKLTEKDKEICKRRNEAIAKSQ
jgi:hypothetical protein